MLLIFHSLLMIDILYNIDNKFVVLSSKLFFHFSNNNNNHKLLMNKTFAKNNFNLSNLLFNKLYYTLN